MITAALVVTFESSQTIERCLRSLDRAGVDEIIVWDNASTDDTVARCHSQALSTPMTVVSSPDNLGFGRALNRLAHRTGADVLVSCNPDAVVNADTVELLTGHLARFPRCAVAGPRQFCGDEPRTSCGRLPSLSTELRGVTPSVLARRLPVRQFPPEYATTGPVGYVEGACFAVRAAAFRRVDGLDETVFLFYEEQELARRLQRIGLEIHLVAEATVDHLGQHSRSVLPAQGAPELIRSASQYLERWHGRGAATTYRAAARLHWMQGARRGRRDAAAPAALGAVLRRREVAPA